MTQQFHQGDHVRMFATYGGVVLSYNTHEQYYSVRCDYCEKEHLMLEGDLQHVHGSKKEDKKHEPVRD